MQVWAKSQSALCLPRLNGVAFIVVIALCQSAALVTVLNDANAVTFGGITL